MATDRVTGSGTVVAARPRRHTGLVEARGAVVRLVLAAALLWGALCGIGYLLTHPLQGTAFERWDASANRWLASRRTPAWNTVTHWLTYAAETLTVIGIALVFFIGLRIALGRWRESMFLAAALAGEVTIFVLTALVINRDRPPVAHLDSAPPTSSFPSGHVAAAMTLYGALAIIAVHAGARLWVRTLAMFGALALPLCVAFARLYRGMHFLTDVMGGALLALAWLSVSWALILRSRRRGRL